MVTCLNYTSIQNSSPSANKYLIYNPHEIIAHTAASTLTRSHSRGINVSSHFTFLAFSQYIFMYLTMLNLWLCLGIKWADSTCADSSTRHTANEYGGWVKIVTLESLSEYQSISYTHGLGGWQFDEQTIANFSSLYSSVINACNIWAHWVGRQPHASNAS